MITWTVPATVTRVIDGDTLVCDLDLGWGIWVHERRVRLAGVNCPEMDTPEGLAAKGFVEELVREHGRRITVISHSLDKYGRVLGEVYLGDFTKLTGSAKGLSGLLLAAGHAVPMRS
jgi:micrococcal nuclease